jgi:hypothetical protein
MVTKKEQNDIIVGPKGVLWIVAAALVIGVVAWIMASSRHEQRSVAYDQLNPAQIIEQTPNGYSKLPEDSLKNQAREGSTPAPTRQQ